MCNNFPTIDKFAKGSITSIKSLNTFASSYQRGNTIYNTVMGYANTLSRFTTTRWGGITVNVNSTTKRILELALPSNVTSAQMSQVNRAIGDASRIGVNLVVKYIK